MKPNFKVGHGEVIASISFGVRFLSHIYCANHLVQKAREARS